MRNLTTYMNLLACLALIGTASCRPKAPPQVEPEVVVPNAAPVPAALTSGATASTLKSTGRVIALGDVHGDFAALQAALRLAGLIDEQDAWVGGEATLVQTGDLLDRGDDERRILEFFEILTTEARAAGGQVVSLNGNHEVMNVAGDLRYVTAGGFKDFADVPGLDLTSPRLQQLPEATRPRAAAFMPGGPYAMLLARKRVIAVVDDTVFAHGGVLKHHVAYGIDALNAHTAEWMRGERDAPIALQGDDSPIWTRVFSDGEADCDRLNEALEAVGAARMVVGHTPQMSGITSACDGKVWRVDVGMAAHYGGAPAALEITAQGVRPIAAQN